MKPVSDVLEEASGSASGPFLLPLRNDRERILGVLRFGVRDDEHPELLERLRVGRAPLDAAMILLDLRGARDRRDGELKPRKPSVGVRRAVRADMAEQPLAEADALAVRVLDVEALFERGGRVLGADHRRVLRAVDDLLHALAVRVVGVRAPGVADEAAVLWATVAHSLIISS